VNLRRVITRDQGDTQCVRLAEQSAGSRIGASRITKAGFFRQRERSLLPIEAASEHKGRERCDSSTALPDQPDERAPGDTPRAAGQAQNDRRQHGSGIDWVLGPQQPSRRGLLVQGPINSSDVLGTFTGSADQGSQLININSFKSGELIRHGRFNL